ALILAIDQKLHPIGAGLADDLDGVERAMRKTLFHEVDRAAEPLALDIQQCEPRRAETRQIQVETSGVVRFSDFVGADESPEFAGIGSWRGHHEQGEVVERPANIGQAKVSALAIETKCRVLVRQNEPWLRALQSLDNVEAISRAVIPDPG